MWRGCYALSINSRGKMKKDSKEQIVQEVVKENKVIPFDFDSFEFKTIEDFETFNTQVRKFNRTCTNSKQRLKIKVPDESFHKKIKIKFQRFDQPDNVLKTRVRNKFIDWSGQLKPGGVYHLPIPVVEFLNKLATPVYGEVKVEDGGSTKTETRQIAERNRFSCQVLEYA